MPKNFLTNKQLDSKCLHLAEMGENDINPIVRQAIINDIFYKQYGLMDGVNHPFWNQTTTLTVTADQERLADSVTNSGVITAINSTGQTITRSTGVFVAGSILDICIFSKTNGVIAGQWKARVTIGGATATYSKIGTGTEVTFASGSHACSVNVLKKFSATSADMSGLYVKQVVKVYDDQATGNKERVFFEIKDSRIFGALHRDDFYKTLVCWNQQGDTVYLFVGEDATALGIVQAEIIGKPALFSDATENNELTFPPEENHILTDEILAEYLKKAGKQVPLDVAGRLTLYQKRYEAAAADRAKALELRGQRG